MRRRRWPWRGILVLLVAALVWVAQERSTKPLPGAVGSPPSSAQDEAPASEAPVSRTQAEGRRAVLEAFEEGRSGFMAEVTGTVQSILADDEEGSRHQRFILELQGGHTLLVSHNIDLAPRAPIRRGGTVTVRGQYEWNDRGGVLHWTHHDPQGRRPGGWIEVGGERYR